MERYAHACRICLNEVHDPNYMTIENGSSSHLGEFKTLFEKITGFNLLLDEPQYSCASCLQELRNCYGFLKKCKITQEIINDFRKSLSVTKDEKVKKSEEDLLLGFDFALETPVKEEWSDYDDRLHVEIADEDDEKIISGVVQLPKAEESIETTSNVTTFTWTSIPSVSLESRQTRDRRDKEPKIRKPKRMKIEEEEEEDTEIKPEIKSEEILKVICPYCASLVKYSYLKNHIKYVHTEPRNGYSCDICKVTLSSKKSVSRHMYQVHLKKQKYVCKICSMNFESEPLKRAHLVQIHKVVPPKECPYCDYRAFTKGHMDRHVRRHRGDRRFKCSQCGYAFVTLLQLQTHEATHSDERNFECDQCGKKFKTKKNLYAHKKVHLPHEYECLVCSRAFLTNQMMRNHVTKTHPEFELPPPGTVLNKEAVKRMKEMQALIQSTGSLVEKNE